LKEKMTNESTTLKMKTRREEKKLRTENKNRGCDFFSPPFDFNQSFSPIELPFHCPSLSHLSILFIDFHLRSIPVL